ncbi:MAG: hypothetical protein ABI337_08815 [Nitrososphaera sp.]|jgi:hypothetical protein
MRKKQPAKKSTSKIFDIIYLHTENKQRLERLHEEAQLTNPTIKFHPFVESIIADYLDTKESQKKFSYPIEFKAIVDYHIVLLDNTTGKPVLVAMDDSKKSLHCDSCGQDDCRHVGFVYGNNLACNVLVRKGFFPSRSKEI